MPIVADHAHDLSRDNRLTNRDAHVRDVSICHHHAVAAPKGDVSRQAGPRMGGCIFEPIRMNTDDAPRKGRMDCRMPAVPVCIRCAGFAERAGKPDACPWIDSSDNDAISTQRIPDIVERTVWMFAADERDMKHRREFDDRRMGSPRRPGKRHRVERGGRGGTKQEHAIRLRRSPDGSKPAWSRPRRMAGPGRRAIIAASATATVDRPRSPGRASCRCGERWHTLSSPAAMVQREAVEPSHPSAGSGPSDRIA